jgi:hypothetical protein
MAGLGEYCPALARGKPRAVAEHDVHGVHAALRDGGLAEAEVARAERLISTAVLGFAASEAAGRFRDHSQAVLDADFAELLRWLRLALAGLAGLALEG